MYETRVLNMTESELRRALKSAKLRKADAYKIIGVVCGISEKRVEAIAKGAKPTYMEFKILEIHS